jgi:membrane-associated protease RseP (regulator of RpoE activity)
VIIALLVVLAIAMYPAWAFVHEYSHVAAARAYGMINPNYRVQLWPQVIGGRLYWACVWNLYDMEPTPQQRAGIAFTPRYANMLAAIMLPSVHVLPSPWEWAAAIVLGTGLVDLAVGSIGWHPKSDLRRVADGWNVSPWILRVAGFIWKTVA